MTRRWARPAPDMQRSGAMDRLLERRRRAMVEAQLIARGVRDVRVLAAMEEVPRHAFVPAGLEWDAYDDHPLPIGFGQTISQPYMVARMLEALALDGTERVLEVGTGSGYQAALLARLGRRVTTVEIVRELALAARRTLDALGFERVDVIVADGALGWAPAAPYDAIVVAAAAPAVPPALLAPLADAGRLVIPLGPRAGQTLTVLTRHGEGVEAALDCSCAFVPLVGGGPPGEGAPGTALTPRPPPNEALPSAADLGRGGPSR